VTNAVATTSPRNLKEFLEKNIGSIREVAAGMLTPERMVRLVAAAASRDEQLAKCTPLSILRSLSQAASMGLEPFDGRSEVHLVPRWNRKALNGRGALEATCLVGYPGLIRLAMETKLVNVLDAQIVYEKDEFDYALGDDPYVKHRPSLHKDRGPRVAVYAIAKMATGERRIEIIPYHEVEAIRDRSVDKDKFSPWKSDESEMARKTGLRRLAKYLPKSRALAAALEHQAKTEAGEYFDAEPARPGDAPSEPGRVMVVGESGELTYDWSVEDTANFHTACDTLMELATKAGETEPEAEHRIRFYRDQKDAGENPDTVLNRMAASTEKLMKKISHPGAK
jgi:recombination protein RecT